MKKQKEKQKIIVILGPTASGKSDLAVEIALRHNGEVISADSRQIYKDLDIGSGKITEEETKGVPHHLLSFVEPQNTYSVAEYQKDAEKAIQGVLDRGNLPILCGGTGFYIQSIVDGFVPPKVEADWSLRKYLGKKPVEELFGMLKELDPERAENIDVKNPHRLIRAIEIAKKLGKVPNMNYKSRIINYEILQIGIKLPDEVLKEKIAKRVKGMIDEGLLDEVKGLYASELSWDKIEEFGFEYKYPAMFLRGEINGKEMLERMILKNQQYAKRQMTWFKRDERIKWLAPSNVEGIESNKIEDAEKLISEFTKKEIF